MRIVNFILAIMFLGFAFLQINDPDPIIWILIYGAMAIVCLLAVFEFYQRKAFMVLILFYLIYSIYYLPGFWNWMQQDNKMELFDDLAKMKHYYIEEAREFLGLMICVATLLFQWLRSIRPALQKK